MSSISCTGCGREYGEARFAGGRTLVCACGARVGRLLLVRLHDPPRFLVDSMLGGLARWLRVLGYDTAWEPEIADAELVRRGVEEGRRVLTRDRGLAEEWWVEGRVLLRSDDPLEQLREVAEAVGLSAGAMFTRCLRCNLPLEALPAEEAAARVPPTSARCRASTATAPGARGCTGRAPTPRACGARWSGRSASLPSPLPARPTPAAPARPIRPPPAPAAGGRRG